MIVVLLLVALAVVVPVLLIALALGLAGSAVAAVRAGRIASVARDLQPSPGPASGA